MALPPVVSLEIGTSKVRALVGEIREDGYIMVTDVGECPSRGVRKGEIIDFDNALACVRAALQEAEDKGRVTINQVNLLLSGGHIQSVVNRGTIPVMGEGGEITPEDIEQAKDTARAISLPPDRDILHTIPQHFFVDDQAGVINPEGMVGARLSVSMLILHGIRNRVHSAMKVVSSAQTEVAHIAFGGLCSALAVLTAEQKESGVVLLDLGGGTTDYVVYADRTIAAAGCIALGGDHVTNDLALGLKVPITRAEKLKIENGSALVDVATRDQHVMVPSAGGFAGRAVRVGDIHTIIHARMSEIVGMIRDEIEGLNLKHQIGGGAVLTGGGAQLNKMEVLTSDILDMPCQIGRPRNVTGLALATEGPEYAAPAGMLRYGAKPLEAGGAFGPIADMLKRFFRR